MQFARKKCNYDNRNQLYDKARLIFFHEDRKKSLPEKIDIKIKFFYMSPSFFIKQDRHECRYRNYISSYVLYK